MSVVGTGVASAVAQTTVQAQQVASRRDRQAGRTATDAKQLRDLFESRLKILDEADPPEAGSQMRLDEQLPDRSVRQQKNREPVEQERFDDDAVVSGSGSVRPASSGDNFCRHLDVQG